MLVGYTTSVLLNGTLLAQVLVYGGGEGKGKGKTTGDRPKPTRKVTRAKHA